MASPKVAEVIELPFGRVIVAVSSSVVALPVLVTRKFTHAELLEGWLNT